MIPQQSSQNPNPPNRSNMINKLYDIRRDNYKLRKELIQALQQTYNILIKSKGTNQMLKFQTSILKITPKQYAQHLIDLLKFFSQQTQMIIIETKQSNQKTSRHTQNKIGILQNIKNQINSKNQQIQTKKSSIEDKQNQLKQLQQSLTQIIAQQLQLKEKIHQNQINNTPQSQFLHNEILNNWQNQKKYMLALVEERTRIRKQLHLIEKAQILLQKKLHKYQAQFTEFMIRKDKIEFLSQQNNHYLKLLQKQKERKKILQNTKLTHVLNKQLPLAADIVQKWDHEKRQSQNILLAIIEMINNKLPNKKIEDVSKIINDAQKFYQRKAQNEGENNMQSQQRHVQQNQI